MRHGVIELTKNKKSATILLVPDDCIAERKLRLAEELAESGCSTIVVTDVESYHSEKVSCIHVPDVPNELKSIFFTFGLQKVYGSFAEAAGFKNLEPELVGLVARTE